MAFRYAAERAAEDIDPSLGPALCQVILALCGMQRLEELQDAAREQEAQLQEAAEVHSQVANSRQALGQRLKHCSDLQANLHSRVVSKACLMNRCTSCRLECCCAAILMQGCKTGCQPIAWET